MERTGNLPHQPSHRRGSGGWPRRAHGACAGVLDQVVTDDWAKQTIPAWRHSIWAGVWDPWPVFRRPRLWYKVLRDSWCLEVMHRAFTNGLMRYGMMTATKKAAA
mmetsp:Transcript_33199/g.97843  ORF Transcript_33199/g.97843 Transcript_33199/m.97843 type:complete len:105 (+) Transcript_33199:1004-1318(+)